MSPKKQPTKKAAVKDKTDQVEKKLAQSNMSTSLKHPKATQEQKELLELYQSLPRFDSMKNTLLQEWQKDKSCKWINTYTNITVKNSLNTKRAVSGFGTRHLYTFSHLICATCIH
jgi:hypothetical protein